MLAVFQHLHAMARMAGSIRGNEYRLDPVIFDEFLQRRIGFGATAGLGQLRAAVGEQVAHSHDLHVRVALEPKLGPKLADAVTHDPNADPPVRNGLPVPRSVWIFGPLLKALNNFFLGAARLLKRQRGSTDA